MNEQQTPALVAIVTGAAQGIGAAIATRLAQDGMSVAVADREYERASEVAQRIVEAGGRALAVSIDVTSSESVAAGVEEVRAAFGPVTVLINNAGILRDNAIRRMSRTEWEDVLGVHLTGAFLMAQVVQADMVEAGFGRIVSLSSTSALGSKGQVNYSAAKAGVQGLTKTLALELGRFGITANAVAPGFIETDMTKGTAQRLGIDFEAAKQQASSTIPVGRVGHPEDVAHMVASLVDPRAGFVSGQVVYVAGGPRT